MTTIVDGVEHAATHAPRPTTTYVVHGEENGHPVAIPVQATCHSDAQRIAALQPPVTIVHALAIGGAPC